jgi:hypothetical protein
MGGEIGLPLDHVKAALTLINSDAVRLTLGIRSVFVAP